MRFYLIGRYVEDDGVRKLSIRWVGTNHVKTTEAQKDYPGHHVVEIDTDDDGHA
jgi:hypothetical protein